MFRGCGTRREKVASHEATVVYMRHGGSAAIHQRGCQVFIRTRNTKCEVNFFFFFTRAKNQEEKKKGRGRQMRLQAAALERATPMPHPANPL